MTDDNLAPTGSNIPELSVSEVSMALKRTVEQSFSRVRIRGELSGFKRAASGHLYMALKDQDAAMDGVMWRGMAGRLSFRPEDGLEVIATGKLTTYPGRSKYQIVIDHMEPAGAGALMALLEQRKKALAAEGLFDAARKKDLPFLPEVIGVVTSPTGAVIRDILHRLNDRFPRRVLVWPVVVQGDGADRQIAAAIDGFNRFDGINNGGLPRPDLLIVARGGGSIEDLWSFNEEAVVRAAAASDIPLISAVGHETDTTLIDYASDRRAPTPTAAAEMAVPVRQDLVYSLDDYGRRQGRALARLIEERRNRLDGLSRALRSPKEQLEMRSQRLDDLGDRLGRAVYTGLRDRSARLDRLKAGLQPRMLTKDIRLADERVEGLSRRLARISQQAMQERQSRLTALDRMLDSLSWERVLDRGYAVIRNEAGAVLSDAAAIEPGTMLDIQLRDGHRKAEIVADDAVGAARPRKKPVSEKPVQDKVAPKKKPAASTNNQGSLF